MSKGKEIFVYANWAGSSEPVFMGTLTASMVRGGELFEFRYDEQWLKNPANHLLDPNLRFYPGAFYPNEGALNFGLFTDSTPGSWGRALLQKYETAVARRDKRPAHTLAESDYLLGVFDFYRSGALRYKVRPDGEFVTGDEQFILPTLSSLRELERVSLLSIEEATTKEYFSSLEMLVASGAVLNGKRPKATVVDNDWQLWIAKFPKPGDAVDVGGWEFVAHTMAGLAGIETMPGALRKLNSQHHTFLVQRFDRTLKGERIHFASAKTLLGFDGNNAATAPGYLDLAGFLMQQGADVNNDLPQLWKRMVLNIAIKNTDDHLGNHGFLLTNEGWRLSPVYDLNPEPEGDNLRLNITGNESALSFDLALSVADYFRVKPAKAKSIVQEISLVKTQWNKIAADAGLTKAEQERMSAVFEP